MQSLLFFYVALAIVVNGVVGHPNGVALRRRQTYEVQAQNQENAAIIKQPAFEGNSDTRTSNSLYASQKLLDLDVNGANTCGKYSCPDQEFEVVTGPKLQTVHPMCSAKTKRCECWGLCIDYKFPFGLDVAKNRNTVAKLFDICTPFCEIICPTVVAQAEGTKRDVSACVDNFLFHHRIYPAPEIEPGTGASTGTGNGIADSSTGETEPGAEPESESEMATVPEAEIKIDNDESIN